MGILYIVATPIGNLDDISKRCLDTLRNVDLIACEDTRQTIKILNKFDIKKKLVSYHKFNESRKSDDFINLLKNDKNIALVSDAGTPCISDPGYVLVSKARENGIEVIGIPGPSALVTALSISGLNTDSFSFVGFLPIDNKKRRIAIDDILNSAINTFVVYESPKRLVKTLKDLFLVIPNSMVAVCSDLTKLYERTLYGMLEDVINIASNDENIEKGEYVIVLEKMEEVVKKKEVEYSIEALLVDVMVKNNCSVKEAISIINEENKSVKKNEIYNASLNLKKFFKS